MSGVFEITNIDEHDDFIANNDRAVIFFGSIRCGHCRDMVPKFQQLAQKYPSVAFAHVEVTEVSVENVNGVPVFVGYKQQFPLDVILGASPKSIINMIETKILV